MLSPDCAECRGGSAGKPHGYPQGGGELSTPRDGVRSCEGSPEGGIPAGSRKRSTEAVAPEEALERQTWLSDGGQDGGGRYGSKNSAVRSGVRSFPRAEPEG